jgi:hypothetical protein
MKRLVSALASVALLASPMTAVAQTHGGGFHGGADSMAAEASMAASAAVDSTADSAASVGRTFRSLVASG